MGGLACADCHGDAPGAARNADWRPAGHPLGGVGARASLWGGRFEGEDRVMRAALWCAARFQYRMAQDLPRAEGGAPDFAAVPLGADERAALGIYLAGFDAAFAPPPGQRVGPNDVDADAVLERVGDWDRGEALWRTSCAVCHGHEGEGDLGPPLTGADAPDPWTFVEYVRTGAAPNGKDGWMPHFAEDVLSDQDLADLAARWAE